ncbi:hypothetical protein B9479_004049 [Cryptococcus floricola]|uniref:Mediator of RNA polymerase II transcription subunit 8 n=1 Tax=Cryptococcus floricola TaxID=2591691 RepID=A0A5D3AXZ5_9TREE|nr:hypothetical protein B9479_004049 [Cryptococcus floricola]
MQYHAPLPPALPLPALAALLPRLTTTINDIDALRALLANGAHDASLPSWDILLQRYSLLLGRINALSNTLTAPARAQTAGQPPANPLLAQYIVHPLNPLPPPDAPDSDISPLAQDAFFQAINTMPLPAPPAVEGKSEPPRAFSQTHDQLRAMSDRELEDLRKKLTERIERDGMKGKAVSEEVERRAEEIDWVMRVGQDEDEGGEEKAEEDKDEDDDLFGSDEDEPMEGATEARPAGVEKGSAREDWKVGDFVRFIDSGA